MLHHFLLFCMLLAYSIPICLTYLNFTDNHNSISSIICNPNNRIYVFISMIVMGFFTIYYEFCRGDFVSIAIISFLLFSIYGLIFFTNEGHLHYLFAGCAFFSIFTFMIYHYNFHHYHSFISLSLFLQFFIIGSLFIFFIFIHSVSIYFMYIETLFIMNFAFFFLYLHFIDNGFYKSRYTSRTGECRANNHF